MHTLTAQDILDIWETGQHQNPVDKALSMLAYAWPDMANNELAMLDIARRDLNLLDLREKIFGPKIHAISECPRCAVCLEFSVTTSDVRVWEEPLGDRKGGPFELALDDITIRFRLPNSADLAAIAGRDILSARAIILQRCIINTIRGDSVLPFDNLSEESIQRIVQCMGEYGKQADMVMELVCPSCGHHYQMGFDIATYLWWEISSLAKRLLLEVHALARAYGWSEGDILSMTSARRRMYIELVG